jgi:hypothetical protein
MTQARVRWTEDEYARVADILGPEYESNKPQDVASTRELVAFAQGILPIQRRRPTGSHGAIYGLLHSVLEVWSVRKELAATRLNESMAALVNANQEQRVREVPLPGSIKFIPIRENRDKPGVKGLAAGVKIQAIVAPGTEAPAQAPESPMSKIISKVLDEKLAEATPAFVEMLAGKILGELLPHLLYEVDQRLAAQTAELKAFWEGPAVTPVTPTSASNALAAAMQTPSETVGSQARTDSTVTYKGSVKPKKRVMVFGATDTQRRLIQSKVDANECEIYASKKMDFIPDNYDYVVVLESLLEKGDWKAYRHAEVTSARVKVLQGSASRAASFVQEFLQESR